MMKKLLLLLSSCVSLGAAAQVNLSSMMLNNPAPIGNTAIHSSADQSMPAPAKPEGIKHLPGIAAKTTATGGSRWYTYSQYLIDNLIGYTPGLTAPYLWNDTLSLDAYSSSTGGTVFENNTLVSIGTVLDPYVTQWNDPSIYAGMIKVSSTDNYVIDSVAIEGIYQRNYNSAAKIAVVDTLIFALVHGNGTPTSDLDTRGWNDSGDHTHFPYPQYGVDTLRYLQIRYDSMNNHADSFGGGVLPQVFKVPLTSTDSSSDFFRIFAVPGGLNVPAGSYPAMSFSFKSGDPSFVTNDTVFTGAATDPYKYGMFRPFVQFSGTTASTNYPTYMAGDWNSGAFKPLGTTWVNRYIPHWAFFNSATSGGSTYQYPLMSYRVTCATCEVIKPVSVENTPKSITAVKVYPVPASDEVNISFSLSSKSDVTVVLSDVLGQVVASTMVKNAGNSKATINTANLPAGVYVYTVISSSDRSTGRIVVAH